MVPERVPGKSNRDRVASIVTGVRYINVQAGPLYLDVGHLWQIVCGDVLGKSFYIDIIKHRIRFVVRT